MDNNGLSPPLVSSLYDAAQNELSHIMDWNHSISISPDNKYNDSSYKKIVHITHLMSEVGQYHSDENGMVGKYVEETIGCNENMLYRKVCCRENMLS